MNDSILVYEWVLFLQTTLEQVALQARANEDKTEAKTQFESLLKAMATRFTGPYVLGEEFTLLDVIVHTDLTWYKMIGLYPEGLEPYHSFLERTAERMGWQN